jgi:hypothetical protein
MTYCATCSSQLAPGARFCANCGTPVDATASRGGPSSYPTRHGGASGTLRDAPAFFSGDWIGALHATLLGVGSMLAVALAAGFVRSSENTAAIETRRLFGEAFQWTAMAVGGPNGDGTVSVTFRPLTLTLIGYTLIGIVFVRRLRKAGTPTAAGAGLQAGRLALMHGGAMILVGVLSRIEGDDQPRAEIFPTMLWGTVTLAIALFVAWAVGLAGLLPSRAEHYRNMVAGPIKSILFLIVISSAATVPFLVLLIWTGTTAETGPLATVVQLSGVGPGELGDVWRDLVFSILLFLPTIAGWSLLLGMGVPSRAGGLGSNESVNILDLTDQNDMLWLWPLGVIALLVATGYYSARKSPLAANGRPVGWWLTAVLPVALVVLALSATITVEGGAVENSLGFDVLLVIALGALYGLAVGMLGSALVSRRSSRSRPGVASTHAFPSQVGSTRRD